LGRNRDRRPLRALASELARAHPALADPESLIREGVVLVDGRVVSNPASLVRVGSSIAFRRAAPLRGELKLQAALAHFELRVEGRVALDLGAAAGGFTRALLDASAARVYAVDAGHGQLLGSLRQDARVVNLERTNLGALDTELVPEPVEIVTVDLSYLPVANAVPQLARVEIAPDADLIALVKPMFELGLASPPVLETRLEAAVDRAIAGIKTGGWRVTGPMRSPVTGARGAIEFLVHARRLGSGDAAP
jgi:23S rRNA (cytidine1920-2'-O)/16S rRNA (cytidine1409-2'-O)-methyltransferase